MSTLSDLEKECICDAAGLASRLSLSDTEKERIGEIIRRYPLKVTPYYLGLIDEKDPQDPIRKLCIPDYSEYTDDGEEDTSGEASNTVVKGMQHKYSQTVLILSTNKCASYCRHCFRKRLVGLSDDEIATHLGEMAEYIRLHPEITNVLISGGDAFLNSNNRIKEYLDTFIDLDQLDLIRFGTRTPVVLPQRITTDSELQDILKEYNCKKQLYVVTQFNHPNEITEEAVEAVRILLKAGIVVKNQTVLLNDINDDPAILSALFRRLTACGVVPYYIFQCRPVRGVLHNFQVPLRKGIRIIEKAMRMQNGQGKCLRYVMSHSYGKIEIIGEMEGKSMLFKYHQAKNSEKSGKIFVKDVEDGQSWLESVPF